MSSPALQKNLGEKRHPAFMPLPQRTNSNTTPSACLYYSQNRAYLDKGTDLQPPTCGRGQTSRPVGLAPLIESQATAILLEFLMELCPPVRVGICATCSTACESAPNWIAKSGPFEKRPDTLFFALIKKAGACTPAFL